MIGKRRRRGRLGRRWPRPGEDTPSTPCLKHSFLPAAGHPRLFTVGRRPRSITTSLAPVMKESWPSSKARCIGPEDALLLGRKPNDEPGRNSIQEDIVERRPKRQQCAVAGGKHGARDLVERAPAK